MEAIEGSIIAIIVTVHTSNGSEKLRLNRSNCFSVRINSEDADFSARVGEKKASESDAR